MTKGTLSTPRFTPSWTGAGQERTASPRFSRRACRCPASPPAFSAPVWRKEIRTLFHWHPDLYKRAIAIGGARKKEPDKIAAPQQPHPVSPAIFQRWSTHDQESILYPELNKIPKYNFLHLPGFPGRGRGSPFSGKPERYSTAGPPLRPPAGAR